jgi:A/G-specific adenine glycosylase
MTAPSKTTSRHIASCLTSWFSLNARDLPWRTTRDPYAIWVSEIMLQQTRVATVVDRFVQFMIRFPSVQALAKAPLDTVRAEWSGLGYYRRCKNLWLGAQHVLSYFDGELPSDPELLREIPGIGPYTASAIAAIAFDVPSAAVDGNVLRVGSRIQRWNAPIDSKKLERDVRGWADAIVAEGTPSVLVQALMELGATVCTPRIARCALCPVASACRSRDQEDPTTLPVAGKKVRPAIWSGVVVVPILPDGSILLERRPEDGLLGGMLFPAGHIGKSTDLSVRAALRDPEDQVLQPLGMRMSDVRGKAVVPWRFTHIELKATVLRADLENVLNQSRLIAVAPHTINDQALPNITRVMLDAVGALVT